MNFNPLHCGVHHIHFDDITGVLPIAIISIFMIALGFYAVRKRAKDNSQE